jgi:beta-aspartyl-peptidase (threonine type)
MRDLAKRSDDSDATAMRRVWNYEMDWPQAVERYACDTVGAVALDAEGHFAVATSTGGSAPSLLGRVGDTPLIGCGYYAGPQGAIAVTGIGEHIIPHLLARTVYGWLETGTPLTQALDRAVNLFPSHIDVGLIGVDKTTAAASSNREMPVDLIHE